MKPTTTDVNTALREIETAELSDEHPRKLATKAIVKFRSDAQRQKLPTVNQHDKGGQRLDPDSVLKWEPGHLGRKE